MPKGCVCSDHKARQIFFISPPATEHGVLEGLFGLEQFWHGTGYGISWAGGTSGISVLPSCPRQGLLHQPLKTFPLMATNTSTMVREVFFGIFFKVCHSCHTVIYLSLTSLKYLKSGFKISHHIAINFSFNISRRSLKKSSKLSYCLTIAWWRPKLKSTYKSYLISIQENLVFMWLKFKFPLCFLFLGCSWGVILRTNINILSIPNIYV